MLQVRRQTLRRRVDEVPQLVRWGLLMVVVQLGVRGWALAGSWFYFDDLAFMSRAMDQPLSPAYLLESYGGHLMPGGFALVWVLTRVAAWQWWLWAAVLLVTQAAAGVGMLRLLLSMFGPRRFVLVLLAGYLAWVLTLSSGIWFAAGINQLPLQLALVYGLHAHLDHLRTGRVRSLVVALAWLVVGLVFYEKTLLLIGVFALVTLGWFSAGNTPQRLRGVWERYRTAVVAYAVLGAAYTVVYALVGLNFSPAEANSQPLAPLAWNLVLVALLPALVGGPFTWQPLAVGSFADPSQLLQLLSWLAVGATVFWAHRTRTISLRAWSLVGLTLLADVVLLASARANIVGPDIAREYRYQSESAALVVLALGLAFLPLRGAVEQNAVRPDVPLTYETPRLVALVTSLVVVLSLVSTVRYVQLWQDNNPTQAWYAQVTRSLDRVDGPVPVVDTGIPQTMLWAYRFPENSYSHVLRNLAAQTSYPTVSVDELYLFDDRGRLRPAEVPDTRTLLPSVGCGYSMKGETRMVLPLDGPVIGGGWWVRMSYNSDARTSMRITAGDDVHRVELPRGLHSVYFTAAGENFDRLELRGNDEGADLCVGDVQLGLPQPAPVGS